MSKASRLFAQRPFLFASSSTQSLSRRASPNNTLSLSLVRPARQRLLYTTRPLCATIVTSATASPNLSSLEAGIGARPSSSTLGQVGALPGRSRAEAAELLHSPTQEDIDDAELDTQVVPPQECKLVISERAAEQLQRISTRENNSDVALRISVESGGCHGYQYKMDLTSANSRQLDDYVFAHPTLRPSNILVDAVSLPLLKGSTLDFVTELIGSAFHVSDNPQAKGSGCGCGVSWELKI